MYKKYLLIASEMGVTEAQHNLGLEYLSGVHFPKDEVKAIAWFLHASAHGFVFSKYNLSKIFAEGTYCGRVKPNKNASLTLLEEIKRLGTMDVTKDIEALRASMKK
jgi:TPR repeat protein